MCRREEEKKKKQEKGLRSFKPWVLLYLVLEYSVAYYLQKREKILQQQVHIFNTVSLYPQPREVFGCLDVHKKQSSICKVQKITKSNDTLDPDRYLKPLLHALQ